MKKPFFVLGTALVLTPAMLFPFAAQAMSSPEQASAAEGVLGFTDEEKAIIRGVLKGVKTYQDTKTGEEKTVHRKHDDDERDHGKKGKHRKNQGDGDLPHGLAKRGGDLPPGLERHLEKYGHLPPGLETRELPDDLKKRLPKAHKGTKRVIVNDDVLLIEEATGVILDILKDVFAN